MGDDAPVHRNSWRRRSAGFLTTSVVVLVAGLAVVGGLDLPGWWAAGVAGIAAVVALLGTPIVERWLHSRLLRRELLQRAAPEGRLPTVAEVAARLHVGEGGDLLRIHEAIPLHNNAPAWLSRTLPSYVERDQHARLCQLLRDGETNSVFVLITGPSAAGKTRLALQAATEVLGNWRLLRPGSGRQLHDLVSTQTPLSRTVIWLDELQDFLTGSDALTEQTVRLLLEEQRPLVIIGTIWPDRLAGFNKVSADGADADKLRAPARAVLALTTTRTRVVVEPRFSKEEEERAKAIADPRLRAALVAAATDGRVTEALAAVPQLLAKWSTGTDPRLGPNVAGNAVLTAAVAARLGGHTEPVPAKVLTGVAIRLMTPTQRALLPPDWEHQAYTWATAPVTGEARAMMAIADRPGKIDGYAVSDTLLDHAGRSDHATRMPDTDTYNMLIDLAEPNACGRMAFVAFRDKRYELAERAWQRAATGGDTMALVGLGLISHRAKNLDAARDYWQRASAVGNILALKSLGLLEKDTGNIDAARRWWEQAAAAGDTDAMNSLGHLESNMGNIDAARRWWEQAAAANNIHAMRTLALMQHQGGNIDAARHWWEQAAAAGDTHAMTHLGLIEAEAIDGDLDAARRWWEQAAAAGDIDAMVGLGRLETDAGNVDAARHWWEQGAAAGDTYAMRKLAFEHYDHGDRETALHWSELGAASGDTFAMSLAGVLHHESGNLEVARHWWEQAAAAGDRIAMEALATLEAETGNVEAARHWREAAGVEPADSEGFADAKPARTHPRKSEAQLCVAPEPNREVPRDRG